MYSSMTALQASAIETKGRRCDRFDRTLLHETFACCAVESCWRDCVPPPEQLLFARNDCLQILIPQLWGKEGPASLKEWQLDVDDTQAYCNPPLSPITFTQFSDCILICQPPTCHAHSPLTLMDLSNQIVDMGSICAVIHICIMY